MQPGRFRRKRHYGFPRLKENPAVSGTCGIHYFLLWSGLRKSSREEANRQTKEIVFLQILGQRSISMHVFSSA